MDWYDPTSTNTKSGGAVYKGMFTAAPAPNTIPEAYRNEMRKATVTIYWTNYLKGTNMVVRSRQVETFVARYGIQNYVY
jgi:hypothetical protein